MIDGAKVQIKFAINASRGEFVWLIMKKDVILHPQNNIVQNLRSMIMKKLLFLMCLIMSCTMTFAKSLVGAGNTNVLKENATAVLDIDYSNAIYREYHVFQSEKVVNFAKQGANDKESFIEFFNKSSQGVKVSADAADAKYKILVELTKIRKDLGRWAPGSSRIQLWGTVKIINIATGNTECTFTLKKFQSRDRYTDDLTYANCFAHLGEDIAQSVFGESSSNIQEEGKNASEKN